MKLLLLPAYDSVTLGGCSGDAPSVPSASGPRRGSMECLPLGLLSRRSYSAGLTVLPTTTILIVVEQPKHSRNDGQCCQSLSIKIFAEERRTNEEIR